MALAWHRTQRYCTPVFVSESALLRSRQTSFGKFSFCCVRRQQPTFTKHTHTHMFGWCVQCGFVYGLCMYRVCDRKHYSIRFVCRVCVVCVCRVCDTDVLRLRNLCQCVSYARRAVSICSSLSTALPFCRRRMMFVAVAFVATGASVLTDVGARNSLCSVSHAHCVPRNINSNRHAIEWQRVN